jgi:hypothetical protein
MRSPQVAPSATSSVENRVPSHTHPSVAGTNTSVVNHSGGLRNRSTSPITTDRSRYSAEARATAPPWLKPKAMPSRSSVRPTNVDAVISAKARIT